MTCRAMVRDIGESWTAFSNGFWYLSYSPAECIGAVKHRIEGNPDPKYVSTSFAERSNLNIRMHTRRFTRLTNAFSKKVENHAHSVALFAMYYNFVRIHKTLRTTPAMAANVSKRLWEIVDMWTCWRRRRQCETGCTGR
jgi:hypothetical protein